jgi:serine protease Do
MAAAGDLTDQRRQAMSNPQTGKIHLRRNRMLSSVAALALVITGVVGATTMSSSTPVRAAAVATSDLRDQTMPSFANVIDHVKPAVVSVKVKFGNVSSRTEGMSGQMNNLPPEIQQFFRNFGGQGQQRVLPTMAQGSGFFISGDGYIVTNNHVVQNARTVVVTMDDGRTLDAKVIGTDPKTDLALLKVKEKGDYPFVSLAKDAPRVGDWVVAIGNPFGLGGTVTAGIVSARGRDLGSGPYDDYMQIDAPINKGNSGGPTFNLKGEVVGVNTAIYSPSGGSVGLGFAIPAPTVELVMNALEHGGVVSRGLLGVRIQPVTPDIADGFGLKTAKGALVDQADPGTPAADAGLKSGDVITALNGEPVKDARELTRKVGALKPGDKAEISYWRDGKAQSVDVKLASQKDALQADAGSTGTDASAAFGLRLAPASQVAGAGDKGVAITGVNPDGAAASKGLSDGDVILEISGKPVSRPADVRAGIAEAKKDGKTAVLMKIKTADGSRFVAFTFPKV